MKPIILYICVFLFMLALTVPSGAQIVDRRSKMVPDTLTLADRISIRTNPIDWLLLLPNFGFELELRNVEWNHWAIGANFRYNWQTQHSFAPAQVYNIAEARGEVRYYWRTREFYNVEERKLRKSKKGNKLKQLFSVYTDTIIKHPNATYYRGAYASYTKYSIMLLGNTGHQGTAVSGGISLGVIKPLYQFAGGNSLDLDMGISAGLCFTKDDEYGYDRESNCYPLLKKNNWHIVPFPVLSEARIALVYRLGTRPITQKYRWRYDVEKAYQDSIDVKYGNKLKKLEDDATNRKYMQGMQHHFDSIYKLVYEDTLKVFQKAETEAAKLKQEQAAAQRAAAEQRKQDAQRAKEEEAKAKEDAKKAKEDAKKLKGKKTEEPEQPIEDQQSAEKQQTIEEQQPKQEEQPAEEQQPEQKEQPAEEQQPEQKEQPAEEQQPEQEEQPAEEQQPEQEEQPAEEQQPEQEERKEDSQ